MYPLSKVSTSLSTTDTLCGIKYYKTTFSIDAKTLAEENYHKKCIIFTRVQNDANSQLALAVPSLHMGIKTIHLKTVIKEKYLIKYLPNHILEYHNSLNLKVIQIIYNVYTYIKVA